MDDTSFLNYNIYIARRDFFFYAFSSREFLRRTCNYKSRFYPTFSDNVLNVLIIF